ncbi:hypothetical protein [Demequina sp. NBRC 110055]|uniref:hypothetical protein n=1 Tax=Demequina sp. NBRC 110055 TaxID=1570344 RepID=UPI000A03DE01|nr:hypothetical protein [Demequina sp. NBRC 110055]
MADDKANAQDVSGHAPEQARGHVAPSKPAVPTTGSIPVVPQDVPGGDADILAPVDQPDSEEILPTAGTTAWTATDASAPSTDASPTDPVRALGDDAVRRASLSASGAIPQVSHASPPLTFQPEEGVAPQPAWFAGDPRSNAPESAASWAAASAAHTPDLFPGTAASALAEATPDPVTAEDATTSEWSDAAAADADADPDPHRDAAPAPAPDASGGDDSAVPPPPTDEHSTPWYRGAIFLTLVGLIVLGGIIYVAYTLVSPPAEDVEIAAPRVVEVAAEPTVEPVTLENPTDFLAAMPATVGVYSMTEATMVEEDAAGLETRVAEVDDLTYSDGETTLELRALQHYDEADATEQFDALSQGGTDSQPVTAGGAQVGQRVTLTGEPASYVWRNGTAVFVLSGPADALEEFWIQFPL